MISVCGVAGVVLYADDLCVFFTKYYMNRGTMKTITIDFEIPGMEISTDNRRELSRVVNTALKGSGRWLGCRYTADTTTIHAAVEDEEKATGVIRSAIKGHSVFSYIGYHENSYENAR